MKKVEGIDDLLPIEELMTVSKKRQKINEKFQPFNIADSQNALESPS